MSETFYIAWYGSGAILLLAALVTTRHTRWWIRILIPSFVFAFAFTTIPIVGPDGGAYFPLALLFVSRDWWLQSAGLATLGIGGVTAIIFAIFFIPVILIRKKKSANHGLESTGAPPAAKAPETHP
jgi:hypothetical protein